MPDTANPTPTEILIDRAFARRAEMARLMDELTLDVAAIVALGKGKHSGAAPGHELTVVAATEAKPGSISFALPPEAEGTARTLAGDEATFRKLFTRVYHYEPVDGFAAVAHALLTATAAKEPSKRETDLVQLCQVTGKATAAKKSYILWPK